SQRNACSEALSAPGAKSLSFESANLSGWDSRFVAFIRSCSELCRSRQIEFRDGGLPEGVRRLLRLVEAVPEKKDAHHRRSKVGCCKVWVSTHSRPTCSARRIASSRRRTSRT